jgi:hypothetical protein
MSGITIVRHPQFLRISAIFQKHVLIARREEVSTILLTIESGYLNTCLGNGYQSQRMANDDRP